MILEKHYSRLVTWRFYVTCEEPELLPIIHDFTTLLNVILSKSFEWLESSIESDLGMRIAIWSLDLAIHDITFSKHRF